MDLPIEKLEKFGLKNFINVNRHYLCTHTVSQTKIASFLQFDADQISIITQPPDNFSRNEKLYDLIQKKSGVKHFLQALDETGNEHIIKFIKETELSVFDYSASTSANSNRRRGIWFNLPEPIDSFCGREDFLSQLHDKLKPRDDSETEVTVLSQVKIVSGLGGIGKTETARRYIMKQIKFYNNFIWINAENESLMTNSFLQLAEEMKIPVKNSQGKSREIEEIVKDIYNRICVGGKSNLIVFDNAEDFKSCRQFFPSGLHPDLTKPVILATSRNQEWISGKGKIQVLPLDVLTDDESLEFLLKELEIPDEDTEKFKEESKEFIQLIGGLPLALQQAVAYIRQEKELRELAGTPYKISDYVKEFKVSMKKFLKFSPVPAPDYSPTVYVTWNLTLLKFFGIKNGEEAIQILAHLSFLYADKIPSSFLHDLVPEIQVGTFSGALKLLKKYSLIKINVNNYCLSIHRQLQCVILQYLKDSDDLSKVVMNLVDNCKVVLENLKLSKSSDIFLNLHQIVDNQFNLNLVTEKFLGFMAEFGTVLSKASRYSESLDLFKKFHNKCRELFGENHENALIAQHGIALNLDRLGKCDESLVLHRKLLEKIENHPNLGRDHPLTIKTKHNMANALQEQKKYAESLELFQQVLAQQNKILGENHPETLTTQNSIALVHLEQGNLSHALELYQNLEEKQILGPYDKNLLCTKHNKAVVLFKMGKFEEASKIFQELHETNKETLGGNHHDTTEALAWIRDILVQEGKSTEAPDILKKVYENRKTNLGEDHPSTILTKYNIAAMLRAHGKYQESLEVLQQVLAQRNKIHGENRPQTLKTQNLIALLHSDLGNSSEALVLYAHVEKKQTDILGDDRPDVLQTKHNKASVLFELGKIQEAVKVFNDVYEKRKEILGESHLDTIKTLERIAVILALHGKFKEALDNFEKVYKIRKNILGVGHPSTITAKQNIDTVLKKLEIK